jgi:hypothetical protein
MLGSITALLCPLVNLLYPILKASGRKVKENKVNLQKKPVFESDIAFLDIASQFCKRESPHRNSMIRNSRGSILSIAKFIMLSKNPMIIIWPLKPNRQEMARCGVTTQMEAA